MRRRRRRPLGLGLDLHRVRFRATGAALYGTMRSGGRRSSRPLALRLLWRGMDHRRFGPLSAPVERAGRRCVYGNDEEEGDEETEKSGATHDE